MTLKVKGTKENLAIAYASLMRQYFHLVRMVLGETVKQGNNWIIRSDSTQIDWKEYENKTTWSDFQLIFPQCPGRLQGGGQSRLRREDRQKEPSTYYPELFAATQSCHCITQRSGRANRSFSNRPVLNMHIAPSDADSKGQKPRGLPRNEPVRDMFSHRLGSRACTGV